MKLYKTLSTCLLVPYLAFMFYRTPQLSDAFIIIALVCLSGFERYMIRMEARDPRRSTEIDELRDKLEIESIKSTIQNLEVQRNLARAKTDALNAGGSDERKRFVF